MRKREIQVVGGFYADPNLHWTRQDTLNWIPLRAEAPGTLTQWQLRDAPGVKPFVRITKSVSPGPTIIDVGPIRGMRNVEGKLFVVAAQTLYQISNTGVAIPYGTVPGVGRVSMAHNQRGLGNELLIVNGSAGYVFNTNTLVFGKITDEGYPGAFVADYVDQYLCQIEPQGRFWFHSDLADAYAYNTLDRYEAEADPDRMVSLLVSHREVLIFGKDTIEPFVNTGASEGTFERASNTVIEVGCAAKFTPRNLDNSVFWLDDKRLVRRMEGYTPVRISTDAIDAAFTECTEAEVNQAYAFTFEARGHKIYYITVPGRFTFGYDVLTGQWHRRSTWNMPHWAVTDAVFWNGRWIVGSSINGRLYELDWLYKLDACDPLVRKRVTGKLWDAENEMTLNNVELKFQTGGEESVCVLFPDQPTGPTISGDAPSTFRNTPYTFSYTIGGGTAPLAVTLRSGILPPGLSLSPTGTISGTPTTIGMYPFVVRVTDAEGLFMDLSDGISVAMPMIMMARLGVNDIVIQGVGDTNWSSAPVSSGGNIRRYGMGIPAGRYATHNLGGAISAAYNDTAGAGAWTATAANVNSGSEDSIYLTGALVIPGEAGVNRVKRSTDSAVTYTIIAGTPIKYLATGTPGGMNAGGMGDTQFSITSDAGLTFTDQVAHGLSLAAGGRLGVNATHYVLCGQVAGIGVIKDWNVSTGLTSPAMPVGIGAGPVRAHAYDRTSIELAGSGTNQILRRVSGGAWVLTSQTFTHPIRQLFWSGANFLAVTSPNGGGPGQMWTSPDGSNGSWTQSTLAGAYELFWVAQEYS